MLALLPPQYDNPVGVGASGPIGHAPAVRSLREFLVVDQHSEPIERQLRRGLPNQPLQQDGIFAHFADLERDMPSGLQYSGQLGEHVPDHFGPGISCPMSRNLDFVRVDAGEPAPKPVVRSIVHDVQKWRRSHDEIDACIGDLRRVPRIAAKKLVFDLMVCRVVAQQRYGFFQNQTRQIFRLRRRIEAFIDFDLRCHGYGLVRRHRPP